MSHISRVEFEELLEMEKLMNVYEEVDPGEEFQDKHDQLVRVDRKFILTQCIDIKQAPFSSSAKVPARLYLFQDLMIIAVPNGSGTPTSIGSMMETEEAGKRKTLKRYMGKYKILSWLDLHRCSVKVTDPRCIQVTFVTRQSEEGKKGSTIRILTRVEKIELWDGVEEISKLLTQLTCFIDDLIESDLRRASMGSIADAVSVDSSGVDSVTTYGGESDAEGGLERTRSWASRKNNLRRNGTLKSHGTMNRRHGSAVSVDTDSVGGLSLADIESRYQLNLDAPSLPNGSVEFIVEFGEGMMGFSLSSGPSVGVIVGRVAENSFSDDAGVCIGDRIIEVDEEPIGLEHKWQDVVDLIKSKSRPLRVKFERFAGRVKDKEEKEKEDHTRKSTRQRQWAKKRQQRVHANVGSDERLVSLTEMEKLYKSGKTAENKDTFQQISSLFDGILQKDPSDAYMQTVSVLREIWSTERTYVLDLRTLVREFIMPLRRKTRRVKCKDAEGSRICEHGLLRSSCSKTSVNAESLLSNEDMRVIFVNVETLVKINTELLSFLEQALLKMDAHNSSVTDVAKVFGPAFERVMPFFKLYAVYCHQYPIAIDHLLICRTQSQELHDALTEREKKAKVSLNSLLIKPVQRLCKYPLLFRQLLRHMGNLHIDGIEAHIEELQHAAKVVEDLAHDVNHIVGQNEMNENMMDVFNELGGEAAVPWLLTPSRKFVTRVNVLMHEAPYNTEAKLHVMYVCTDMILFGKGKDVAGFGTQAKTGGMKGRAVSLRRAFGGSLKKSLRNSIRASSSSHKSGPRTLPKTTVKLTKTIELKSVSPRLLPEKDAQDCFGIELKFVERAFDGKKGTGKQVTNINKLQIWLPTADEQRGVYEDLKENIDKLKAAEEGHKKAQETLGRPKARRNWRTGRSSNHGSMH